MASSPSGDDQDDRQPCPPCRGTGTLVSTSGGTPHDVRCPWCEGTGRWRADLDAQATEPKPDPA